MCQTLHQFEGMDLLHKWSLKITCLQSCRKIGVYLVISDRYLFAQMSLIAQRRNLDMRIVLTYPLGPLPWSLATPQGTLRKTNKSKLIQLLTHNVDPLDDVPGTAAYVIDMMSFVQKLPDTSHVLKYFGLCSIYDSLGPDVCSALPGMHALTGCDTVSAFVGKGKVAALKLVQTNPDISTTLAKTVTQFRRSKRKNGKCWKICVSLVWVEEGYKHRWVKIRHILC